MVKLFSKPSCYQCEATKKYLNNRNVLYEEIDVSGDSSELEKLGFRSVPVVVTSEESWFGFRPEKLQHLS